jgi:hypothetical protein
MKNNIEEIQKKKEKEPSIAMGILKDYKITNKRLIIANIIEGITILILIIGLLLK